jgi:hypothetical protein
LESNLHEIRGLGKEGEADYRRHKHSCRKRRNDGPNSLKEGAVWHGDLLLGGDREIDDCTMAVARQRPTNNRGMVIDGQTFFR